MALSTALSAVQTFQSHRSSSIVSKGRYREPSGGNCFYFHQIAVMEFRDWDHGPGRLRLAKPFSIDSVEDGPVLDPCDIYGHPQNLLWPTIRFSQDGQQVVERLTSLHFEGLVEGMAAVLTPPELARDEDQFTPCGCL